MDTTEITQPLTTLPFMGGTLRFFHSPKLSGKAELPWVEMDDLVSSLTDDKTLMRDLIETLPESPAAPYLTKVMTERGWATLVPSKSAAGCFIAIALYLGGSEAQERATKIFSDVTVMALRTLLPGRNDSELTEYIREATINERP